MPEAAEVQRRSLRDEVRVPLLPVAAHSALSPRQPRLLRVFAAPHAHPSANRLLLHRQLPPDRHCDNAGYGLFRHIRGPNQAVRGRCQQNPVGSLLLPNVRLLALSPHLILPKANTTPFLAAVISFHKHCVLLRLSDLILWYYRA